ncbi:NB-ARC domain-containing protein [Kamptonema sp. UHCC 0994]|uniref:NB-ARC domain-containing protein n=1 Tax=Kamptonema sp. UHCC 0994 TaxID=3031329 RepID=UPI0023B8AC2D|nr:NB-ARC domain-containing protein [Kamptonema sp. UHCC 0994]MDF0552834.1 NB-ARC domain-containing protein [Kamptonema sp. UHCC 0994]
MTTQIPQDFVQAITKERGVTDAELETVFMALEGQPTAAIATKLGISDIAVRKRLGEVYKKFKIGGNGPGKLAELRHQLLFLYQAGQSPGDFMSAGRVMGSAVAIAHHQEDWGEAPDVSVFYGRTEELAALNQWILSDGCRLVALLGLGGSGKTTLAVKAAKLVQDEFDFIVWRSLRAGPSVEDLLANLISIFSHQQKPDLPVDLNARISRLVEYFRKQRCLLILDDFEMVLSAGELAGRYRPGLEGYRELIARLGEVNHNSCLILISSEEPTELALISGEKVKSLKPLVSEEIAREIFNEKGLSAKDKDWKVLMSRYGGNLLAFKIVAATIQDFFEGNISNFLEATGLFIEDHISNLLAHQFERLSNSELEIIYWLAITQNPVSLTKLRDDILVKSSLSDLLKNLESLGRRSLIEKINEGGGEILFTLQPLIMKYVTEDLVKQLRQEILEAIKTQRAEKMWLLKTHYFGKAIVKSKGGKSYSTRSILSMVKNQLQTLFMQTTSSAEALNILEKVASELQDKSQLDIGYASENIRNILAEMTNS